MSRVGCLAKYWLWICLLAGLAWTSGSDPVSARRPERAVILIGCESPSDPLCQALQQEVAMLAPGRVPRIVTPGKETPSRAGDLGLRLEQKARKARLVWFTSEPNVTDKTTWIAIPVTKSPLSSGKARETARALLDVLPGLLTLLDPN